MCRELERLTGTSATILARQEHAAKFERKVKHFETRTSRNALQSGDPGACRWHERLPMLEGYDVVISDNLPDVLEIRNDAVLMGSFLWHQALEGIDAAYRRTAERLLDAYQPVMLGSGLFASELLRSSTRFVDVGLFEQSTIAPGKGTDLLVSCGYTDECLEQTQAAVRILATRGMPPYERVYVEPRALPDEHPDWIVPADFSAKMYSSLAAAVLRPGAGTVTDALQAGARLFCFYETGNGELKYNARQIEQHGYGVDCGEATVALDNAMQWGARSVERKRSMKSPDFNGAARAAAYLASIDKDTEQGGVSD